MCNLYSPVCTAPPGLQCAARIQHPSRLLVLYTKNKHNQAAYSLSVYYIIVIDIYLKIISISYKIHISEYIVYIKNNNGVFVGKCPCQARRVGFVGFWEIL